MNGATRAVTRLTALASVSIVAAVGGPSVASASVTIGGDIAATGTASQCADAVCEVAQFALAGARTQAPFDGVVVRWRVNGASGSLALRVLRPPASITPSSPPARSRHRRARKWRPSPRDSRSRPAIMSASSSARPLSSR